MYRKCSNHLRTTLDKRETLILLKLVSELKNNGKIERANITHETAMDLYFSNRYNDKTRDFEFRGKGNKTSKRLGYKLVKIERDYYNNRVMYHYEPKNPSVTNWKYLLK